MKGMPPNSDPGVIEPGQRQTINPMFINPNQRTFQSFNPNLPSNMYGNVTTGRSNYQNSPYFISPEGTTTSVGNTSGGGGYPSTITGFDDTFSVNTPVLTTEGLRTNLEAEKTQKAADARARADDISARAAENNVSIFKQNQLDGNSSANTGSNLPGMNAVETAASRYDPRGVPQIPNNGMYGNTYYNTYSGGVDSKPSHATDNDKPAGPGDTGYDQARKLEALQSGGTGIIYENDRRKVYLDGVLIGNPKSADSANKMLAKAQAEKSGSVSTQDNTNTSGGK